MHVSPNICSYNKDLFYLQNKLLYLWFGHRRPRINYALFFFLPFLCARCVCVFLYANAWFWIASHNLIGSVVNDIENEHEWLAKSMNTKYAFLIERFKALIGDDLIWILTFVSVCVYNFLYLAYHAEAHFINLYVWCVKTP